MSQCKNCKEEFFGIYIETTHTVCEHCGFNNEDANEYFELIREKVKLLTDFFKDEYISYENIELIKLVRELNEFVDSDPT